MTAARRSFNLNMAACTVNVLNVVTLSLHRLFFYNCQASVEMRYCRDCHDKIEEKRLKKQFSEFYKFAADLLSKAYKVNFSIEDVHYIFAISIKAQIAC